MSSLDPIYFLVKLPAMEHPELENKARGRIAEVRAHQVKNIALANQQAAAWLGQIEQQDGKPWAGDIAVCIHVSTVAPKRLQVVGGTDTDKKEG